MLLLALAAAPLPLAAQEAGPRTLGPSGLPLPRFASLASKEVNVRTGPSTDHPIRWVYARPGLPVRIVEESELWRRIEDPDGETGWAHSSLLSVRRTVLVTGDGRAGDAAHGCGGRAAWWPGLEPGVIGELIGCERRLVPDRGRGRARLAAGDGTLGRRRQWRLSRLDPLRPGRDRSRPLRRGARLGAADAHHHVDPVDHLARRRLGQARNWIASSGTSMISPVDLSK